MYSAAKQMSSTVPGSVIDQRGNYARYNSDYDGHNEHHSRSYATPANHCETGNVAIAQYQPRHLPGQTKRDHPYQAQRSAHHKYRDDDAAEPAAPTGACLLVQWKYHCAYITLHIPLY